MSKLPNRKRHRICDSLEVSIVYHENRPVKGTDSETICVIVAGSLPYVDMVDYIRSWPDKLVSFVVGRLCDDDMVYFARELYEYIGMADRDGPSFETWRIS